MEDIKELFFNLFKNKVENIYLASSRINILGEHLEYKGGNVITMPINLYTKCLISKRSDSEIHLYSNNRKGLIVRNLSDLSINNKSWENYPIGAIYTIIKNGYKIDKGFNILYDSTIPLSANLASSASLLSVTVYAINDILNLGMDNKLISLIAWETKHRYINNRCSITDFASIALGKKANLLSLDCYKYKTSYFSFKTDGYKLLIINTNKERLDSSPSLKDRDKDIDIALDILKQKYDIENICDLEIKELPNIKELLNDNVYKYVLHIIEEKERINKFIDLCNKNDIDGLAHIINSSQESLKNNYEITGKHIDILIESSNHFGAIAARMMNEGFGGSIFAIVKNEDVDNFIKNVENDYYNKTNIKCDIYVCESTDGIIKC